ncbi:hypothetical protein MMC17_006892 [Xylographa soralifera]|nr:hypothetical protein [Xylographa soralifera]MCJ1383778.1 hypothetical protein [Xylographa soralifera]
MGRPRKRRAIAPAVSQPGQLAPATIAPAGAFDFSDLAFDASLPNTEWGALGQLEFPPLSLGSEWNALSEDLAVPVWDPNLMLDSPKNIEGDVAVHAPTDPTPAPPSHALSSPLSSIPPPPCACLPMMYLTLSTLQTLPPTFPLALPPLRAATDAVRHMLDCATCAPPSLATATHTPLFSLSASLPNTMLLATLIPHIAHRYAQLLGAIDSEAACGARKTFRVGETGNPLLEGLHTGQEGCPVAVEVEMEAQEWRGMMRGVVRRDLLGEGGLVGLVERMGERQRAWHEVGVRMNCGRGWKKGLGDGEPMCLRVVEATRCAVQMVDVS